MNDGNRRLAGILAADIVGYSRLLSADEPGTLSRVRALRVEIIEPIAQAHGGRIFKTTGDGFLAAFASAVQAVRLPSPYSKPCANATTGYACASASTRARW